MDITEMHLRLTESWKQMRSAADALEPLLRQLGIEISSAELSQAGRDALEILANVQNLSSPAAAKCLDALPQDEHVLVMDGLLNQLRTVPDWQRRPKGFSGAWLLARRSPEAAEIFKRFLADLAWGRNPPWLNALLKDSPCH